MSTTVFGVDLQQAQSKMREAVRYWGEAMRGVLPAGMRRSLQVGEEQLIVHLAADGVELYQRVGDKQKKLATYDYIGEQVDEALIERLKKSLNEDNDLLLTVADDVVLSKPIDFPAAAESNLRQAIFYEMDKHTPFPKEDILFDVAVTHRHAAKLQAKLYILHRSQVAPVLTAFERAKIRFDRICPVGAPSVNLLPQGLRRKRALVPYKQNVLLALVLLGVLFLLFAVPLYVKRNAVLQLQTQVAQLEQQAAGEGELWEKRDEAEQVIVDFINTRPLPFSQIYEELAKQLPDDTWASNLNYADGKISIRGDSVDATALTARINASPLFENARLVSPIVKSRLMPGKEAYNISADVVTTDSEENHDQ